MTISSHKATVWRYLETFSGLGFSLEKVLRKTYSFTTVAYYNSLLKIFKGTCLLTVMAVFPPPLQLHSLS